MYRKCYKDVSSPHASVWLFTFNSVGLPPTCNVLKDLSLIVECLVREMYKMKVQCLLSKHVSSFSINFYRKYRF